LHDRRHAGRDTLVATPGGDVICARGGDDTLRGRGRDFLQGDSDADLLSDGSGSDVADYGERTLPVRVTIGRRANDGRHGEGDIVLANVERVRGGHAGNNDAGTTVLAQTNSPPGGGTPATCP
jgi:hypothetical protein